METIKTFVLDGERFEIESLSPKAKHMLHLITEIRQKTELEIQISELAIDRLTNELKTMVGEFVKVEEPTEGTEPEKVED